MKDTKHMRQDFFILSPESCPRGGTQGCLGAKIKFCPAVCPFCYLLLNHWTKFNQIWSVGYSYKWGVQRQFFLPRPCGLGEESKGQISFNFNYTVNFKDYYTKRCVCTHKLRYKTYQMGFLFCRLGHALGSGLVGANGHNHIPSCFLSVVLSPPKPSDEILPNLGCGLLL